MTTGHRFSNSAPLFDEPPIQPAARSGTAEMMLSIGRAVNQQRFRDCQNGRAMLQNDRLGLLRRRATKSPPPSRPHEIGLRGREHARKISPAWDRGSPGISPEIFSQRSGVTSIEEKRANCQPTPCKARKIGAFNDGNAADFTADRTAHDNVSAFVQTHAPIIKL
jgi:hypothetical protein